MKPIVFLLLFSAISLQAGQRTERYNRLTQSWASYPEVTIQYIQEVHQDSLLIADSLQNSIPSRWTLQLSPAVGDTVVVTALCLVPGKVLGFTGSGYTMVLYDTAENATWRGMFARCSSDTANHILDGFLNVERGDIIKITGVISEFPSNSMNSVTQFQPIPGIAIDILGSKQVPAVPVKAANDFYLGLFPGGKVVYSGGEPYEGMVVEFHNLTVNSYLNATNGTINLVDGSGNMISTYDASRWFTFRAWRDTTSTYALPPVNAVVDTLRGLVTTVSGSEGPRGYRIAPIYPGDLKIGAIKPLVSTHRRYPVVVKVDSAALVTARVTQQAGGSPLDTVFFYWSLDNAPFTASVMTLDNADTLYKFTIPAQPAGTFVKYYIVGTDITNNATVLANAGSGGASSDTSKGFFFYTVLDHEPTISDIQTTPYTNGRSPYVGAVVSVSGVVTADTANIAATPLNVAGTSAWYMQTGDETWNGIWIVGDIGTMGGLRNGDSITVTGTVAENFDVTRIQGISSVVVNSTGNTLPAPVDLFTGVFGPNVGNGDPSAEPFEGMLVRFSNLTVTAVYPVFSDITEFEVDDGSGPIIVRRDGTNSFSNLEDDTLQGKTILREGHTISNLTGVIYYSFNRYKIVPRTNADYGTVVDVKEATEALPASFGLSQNYPNPFNPVTRIDIALPRSAEIDVRVYNLLGQRVATLAGGMYAAGVHHVEWNGLTDGNQPVPSGVYLVRMTSDAGSFVRKILLMK